MASLSLPLATIRLLGQAPGPSTGVAPRTHTRPPSRIGVISDTHGLVRPEAPEALRGSDLIIHAGDVGAPEVLERLGSLATVAAVRGNVDGGAWADELPEEKTIEVAGVRIHVIHNIKALDAVPGGCRMVISGHSHKPSVQRRDGIIYLNPGSAGPGRFTLPVAVATIRVNARSLRPELVELAV